MGSIYRYGAFGALVVAAALAGGPAAQAAAVASRDAVAAAQTSDVVKVDRRGRRTAGYAAAGVLGLATGALIVGANRDRYEDDYYDEPRRVYVEPRRRYYRERCEVVRYRENRYGEVVRVVTYRPC